jgi:hypothetical protein
VQKAGFGHRFVCCQRLSVVIGRRPLADAGVTRRNRVPLKRRQRLPTTIGSLAWSARRNQRATERLVSRNFAQNVRYIMMIIGRIVRPTMSALPNIHCFSNCVAHRGRSGDRSKPCLLARAEASVLNAPRPADRDPARPCLINFAAATVNRDCCDFPVVPASPCIRQGLRH